MFHSRAVFIFVFILNIVVCGCKPDPSQSPGTPRSTSLNLPSPYEMPANRKKAFVDDVKKLRNGQSSDEIVKLLGPPDYQYTISAKENKGPLGRGFRYYFRRKEDGVNEKYDQSVSLEFDNEGALCSAGVQNIPDLVKQFTNLSVSSTNWNEQKQVIEFSFKPHE